jgi:hypothetical protein
MKLFGTKPSPDHARLAGEILAVRVALATLLEAVGTDFPIVGEELIKLRAVAILELQDANASRPTIAGFVEFMRSFIAAAKRHD